MKWPVAVALPLALALCSLPQPCAAEDPPKRPVPDYDGREEPTTAGDVLLWIPRLILSPLYVVSEYVIRRPLGFLITEAERAQLPLLLYDFFLFGPDHKAGVLPYAFLDFGFDPSVGLYFFYNDLFTDGHDLVARGATWGEDWIAGSLSSRTAIGDSSSFAAQFSAVRRPDYAFYGVGTRTFEDDLTRYGATTYDGSVELDLGFAHASRIRTQFGVRSRQFYRGLYGDDLTLRQGVRDGRFEEPYGYEDGYTVFYGRAVFALDSRDPAPASGSGVRLELRAEQGSEIEDEPNAYLRYGGALGGFWDLNDRGRVVSLWAGAFFADPLQGSVPFTELVELGGAEAMRGFVPGRLLGRSAAVMTLAYRWPVWVQLAGSIQLSVGNVFGEHLEGFEPRLLRFSGAIGIESAGGRDSAIELLFGLGSETFADGGEITSFRFIFGTHYGF
jgi:hypothetical protein